MGFTYFLFSPLKFGKNYQFDGRIFFRWVGSTINQEGETKFLHPELQAVLDQASDIQQQLLGIRIWRCWNLQSAKVVGFQQGRANIYTLAIPYQNTCIYHSVPCYEKGIYVGWFVSYFLSSIWAVKKDCWLIYIRDFTILSTMYDIAKLWDSKV